MAKHLIISQQESALSEIKTTYKYYKPQNTTDLLCHKDRLSLF